ncbi:MAG TPA: acetyl-CoA carboxylase biotin carboxyl carrier protein [Acidobacteriota bacterium]|nr:acetyl-CoA carboxylase biotin carboxyl carrier protein [Acidobacteriota bacterium]
MNIKEVKDLIQEVLQSDISEFELEHTGTKIRLRRGYSTGSSASLLPVQTLAPSAPSATSIPPASQPPGQPVQEETKEPGEEDGLHFITSPIVGTFYRSSSPGAESYVKVGSVVDEGAILCIVEAMKLMNEIPSDISGEIVRIYVENGHPVEFAQKLFAIRPRR